MLLLLRLSPMKRRRRAAALKRRWRSWLSGSWGREPLFSFESVKTVNWAFFCLKTQLIANFSAFNFGNSKQGLIKNWQSVNGEWKWLFLQSVIKTFEDFFPVFSSSLPESVSELRWWIRALTNRCRCHHQTFFAKLFLCQFFCRRLCSAATTTKRTTKRATVADRQHSTAALTATDLSWQKKKIGRKKEKTLPEKKRKKTKDRKRRRKKCKEEVEEEAEKQTDKLGLPGEEQSGRSRSQWRWKLPSCLANKLTQNRLGKVGCLLGWSIDRSITYTHSLTLLFQVRFFFFVSLQRLHSTLSTAAHRVNFDNDFQKKGGSTSTRQQEKKTVFYWPSILALIWFACLL